MHEPTYLFYMENLHQIITIHRSRIYSSDGHHGDSVFSEIWATLFLNNFLPTIKFTSNPGKEKRIEEIEIIKNIWGYSSRVRTAAEIKQSLQKKI